MLERVRVAVVDDHPLFRDGVVHTLSSVPDLDVVAEGATAQDAVQIALTHSPDIMLLDVNMPGGGIEAAQEIRQCCPSVKTALLTVSENANHVSAAMQSGISAYIVKGCSGPELLQIIRVILKSEAYVTPSLAARVLAQPKETPADFNPVPGTPALSHREIQVLELASEGLMNKEIAHRLSLTEKTVKYYMTELMQKLKVRNRVEAVLLARRGIGGTKRMYDSTYEPQ